MKASRAIGVLAAAGLVFSQAALADEGGVSFWVPGFFGSLAATPQQPGFSLTSQAVTGATEIAIAAQFDRNPDNFDIPKNTKIKIDGAHTFVNGLIIGGSLESTIDVGSGEITYDLETTFGYKWKVNDIFSLRGRAGVGERFQPASAGRNFPYYVLYVGSDIDLSAKWTWNVVTYRFRDAFDTSNSFNTPEVSTRLTFKIDDGRSVFAAYHYGWSEGSPDYQGIGIGFKYSF